MDISLITSLYRSEAHLVNYTRHVLSVAQQVKQAGLSLEIILVANDPTEEEERQLDELLQKVQVEKTLSCELISVDREYISKSWNRGLAIASAPHFGFWNVDDRRTAGALIAGHKQLESGSDLVDFPYDLVVKRRWFGKWEREDRKRLPNYFNHEILTPRIVLGTFFMASKSLVEKIGNFNENFQVVQDFEWTARAMGTANYQVVDTFAGDFVVHGGNLSNIGRPIEIIEMNIVLMQRGIWRYVRPTPDPQLMRECWDAFGNNGENIQHIPPHIQDLLWGNHALEHYTKWKQDYDRQQLMNRLRRPPRYLIDQLGLRSYLARLGIVQPES